MKKILLMVLVLTVFASAQIFRPSESGTQQPKIEYLQDGILLRFDFVQTEQIDMDGGKSLMWKYQEFWIPLNMSISGIQKYIGEKGYKLAVDEIEYLQGKSSVETATYWEVPTIRLWLKDNGVPMSETDGLTKDELQLMVKGIVIGVSNG